MRWTVLDEQPLYQDEWLKIRLADVELPDGTRLAHRVIRTPPSAAAALTNDRGRVLLLWRHRFITDAWGWEIPCGKVEPGEDAMAAAAREAEEETGWRPGPLRPLVSIHPDNGISDSTHHVFAGSCVAHVGPRADPSESDRVEWIPLAGVPALIGRGQIRCGTTLTALLYLLATRAAGER
jgi:8-oxo-dGTP pyrophosphatase MutT (NUDIX family)